MKRRTITRCLRAVAFGLVWCCAAQAQDERPAPPPGAWPLAGRQGIIQFVIVPLAQARDRAAYAEQLDLLCEPQMTCFINFFTNSANAAVTMPLPDAIANEATALFRRSTKQGAELFRWSCRLGLDDGNCF